jgi:hypothetical protein
MPTTRRSSSMAASADGSIYDNEDRVEAIFVGKAHQYNRRFLQMCSHHLIEPEVQIAERTSQHPKDKGGSSAKDNAALASVMERNIPRSSSAAGEKKPGPDGNCVLPMPLLSLQGT